MGNRLYLTCKNGLNSSIFIQALRKLAKQQNLFLKEKVKEKTEQKLVQVYALLEEAGEDRKEYQKQLEEMGNLLDVLECEKICFSSLPEGNNAETFEEKSEYDISAKYEKQKQIFLLCRREITQKLLKKNLFLFFIFCRNIIFP